METIFSFLGTVIVALIGLIGIWIQTKSNAKLKKQDELVKSIDAKIDALRKESKEDDIKLNIKLDKDIMETCKVWLITEMSKIRNGDYKPNEEQKKLLYDTKHRYNEYGGDSYVDDMFEELKELKLI